MEILTFATTKLKNGGYFLRSGKRRGGWTRIKQIRARLSHDDLADRPVRCRLLRLAWSKTI